MGAITIYAIKSAICLALLYLPYTLLMRQDTFHAFNRVLLLSIVVLSLVMPLFRAFHCADVKPELFRAYSNAHAAPLNL